MQPVCQGSVRYQKTKYELHADHTTQNRFTQKFSYIIILTDFLLQKFAADTLDFIISSNSITRHETFCEHNL